MTQNPTVLIVDDERMNVELLAAVLLPLQFEVRTAADGAEALDSLAKEPVDLVLLDVMMPKINGYEVCRRIRADRRLRAIPIILITALHETSERIQGIDAGCDEFITKPFDKNEVVARIRTLLRLNFYRSQIEENDKLAKGSFLSQISDKLREPLAQNLRDLGALKAQPSAVPRAMAFLGMVEKIFDLLTVSDPAHTVHSNLGKDPMDTADIQALVSQASAGRDGQKKVECACRLAEGLQLDVGEEALRILFGNLIENSGKFNDQPVARVNLSAVREGGRVRFTVSDNGQGMPGGELENVFDPFYQVDRQGLGKGPGLGLGLAIVKRIVQANHGEIRADLPRGGGMAVTFTLPLALA